MRCFSCFGRRSERSERGQFPSAIACRYVRRTKRSGNDSQRAAILRTALAPRRALSRLLRLRPGTRSLAAGREYTHTGKRGAASLMNAAIPSPPGWRAGDGKTEGSGGVRNLPKWKRGLSGFTFDSFYASFLSLLPVFFSSPRVTFL